jgi:sulfur-oxidizing protein SoxY
MGRLQSRRAVLARGTAALALPAAVILLPSTIAAAPAEMRAAIRGVTAGAEPKPGRVQIEVPPLSENGNTVPITVTVESPMTAVDHVKAIHLFNDKNPQPNVISAWFGPRAGQAMLQTRARLSDTQTIVAVAQMSDGSFWTASANVIVTLGACLEEPI